MVTRSRPYISAQVESRHPWRRRFKTLLLIGVVFVFLAVTVGSIFLASLPDVGDAPQRVARILAEHGGADTGLPLPSKVSQAIVAIEDRRFYSHPGIDFIGVAHAAWNMLTTGSPQAGATIAQQLAKNLYIPDEDTLSSKLDQVGVGVKLEMAYSKEQVLGMYMNAIYYGEGQWGIVQASQHYFGKAPDDLDWAEASLLAGLPQAPSAYAPSTHLDLAKQRQRLVLNALVRAGALTKDEADAAYAEPLALGQ